MDEEQTGSPLSESEQRKIDEAFSGLAQKDYYEILGLERQADKGQIKRAYYQVSKEFHPDRFFRRPLGNYKEKLEILFDVITKAYNTLSDGDKRSEYDHAHPVRPASPPPAPAAAAASAGGRPGAGAPATLGPRPVAPRVPRPSMPPPKPVFQNALTKQLLERRKKAMMYLQQGKELFDAGEYQKCLANLQLALSFEPGDTEARRMLNEATARVADDRAEVHYQRGQQQEMIGSTEAAKRFYQAAVDCKPKKGYYYFKMAQMLTDESEGRARLEQLKLAVQFEPDNLEYLLAVAEGYEKHGMPRNALREYEKVLKLAKGHDAAEKAVRRLKAAI